MMKRVLQFAVIAYVAIVVLLPGQRAWGETSPRKIEVTAKRFTFTPGDITLKKGEPVILIVKSDDVAHGIRFRELNVDLKVRAHQTAQVQFTPEKTGDFAGHCSVFCGAGHGSMILKLHVVD